MRDLGRAWAQRATRPQARSSELSPATVRAATTLVPSPTRVSATAGGRTVGGPSKQPQRRRDHLRREAATCANWRTPRGLRRTGEAFARRVAYASARLCTPSCPPCSRRFAQLRGRVRRRRSDRPPRPSRRRAADDRLRGAFPRRRRRAIVAEQHTDTPKLPTRPMPAQHLRRVNLIERQRDQSESAAVSSARSSTAAGTYLLFVAAVDPPSAHLLASTIARSSHRQERAPPGLQDPRAQTQCAPVLVGAGTLLRREAGLAFSPATAWERTIGMQHLCG